MKAARVGLMCQLALLLLALGIVGCGKSGPKRHAIKGKVTVDGQPLVYGLIYFNPDTSQGHKGPQGAGEIRDGHYSTNPDYGPVPGPHLVRITGWNTTPEKGTLGPPLVSSYESHVDIPSSEGEFNFDIPPVKKK